MDCPVQAGLRLPGEQRQVTPTLPIHLVDVLTAGDGMQTFSDSSGNYQSLVQAGILIELVVRLSPHFF